MGMYTGLRVKCIIKQEYRDDIDKLINSDSYYSDLNHDIFQRYTKISRADFIPFGSLVYMPDCWEYDSDKKDENGDIIKNATNGFNRKFDRNIGLLTFQCSLKNYNSTIEMFLKDILCEICEKSYHIETLYEEDAISTLYEIVDKQLTELPKGIRYSDSDEGEDYMYYIYGEVIDKSKDYDCNTYDYSYNGLC